MSELSSTSWLSSNVYARMLLHICLWVKVAFPIESNTQTTLVEIANKWGRTVGGHIHFVLCEVVRLAISVDQLDISNSQAFELGA